MIIIIIIIQEISFSDIQEHKLLTVSFWDKCPTCLTYSPQEYQYDEH